MGPFGALSIFSAVSSLVSGLGGLSIANNQSGNPYLTGGAAFQASISEQQNAIDQQKALYDQQAEIALQEAGAAANQKAQSAAMFQSAQALQYLSAGVTLSGSPMRALEYTRTQAQMEIDAITNHGRAQADLLRRQAAVMGANSEAQLLGEQGKYITDEAQQRISGNITAQNMRTQAIGGFGSAIGDVLQNPGAVGSLFKNPGQQWSGLFKGVFGNRGSNALTYGSTSSVTGSGSTYGY